MVNVNMPEEEQECMVGLEDSVCETFSSVCEITYGAISEREWKEALEEDVELCKVCEALENENFSKLEKV
ncbi:hypothetical protein NDU88_002224 [Pleurodeles waltl]|uniref:Uncharacterized protein n=1 Tax=Pleurodeles waltl TaxID=8319 RepID=A0AAV7M3G5_PLEWA|nr:hypothetical protein NDU88_002224 [Pleurodeles waltl]